ncbi:MAG: HD-GYP domain-containing protein [Burkholderiaceae bacterium]|nr:HD-GYP domain-containing protein [Burkholderiaceae bacterium]
MSTTQPEPGLASVKRYQIPVERLQEGMFVVELDRPWLDTPFLLQGFLVDSRIELDRLRRYCQYVYVDLDLSHSALADAIREAELRDESAAPAASSPTPLHFDTVLDEKSTARPAAVRPVRIRADVKISRQTRERFRDFIRATAIATPQAPHDSTWRRALDWLHPGGRSRAANRTRNSTTARRPALDIRLPKGIELHRYADRTQVEAELPRAREAFGIGARALDALVADVRQGRVPDVQQVSGAVDQIVESMVENPDALMWVARLREESVLTYQHGVKVALYLVALGRHLGFPRPELANLGMIGMLADVGKTRLPNALLEKPGMLAPAEYNIVKEHVRLGLDALASSVQLAPAIVEGIAQHHERLDGSGYPKGLRGDEIGIYGRMSAIADSFAALITARAYANACAPQDALMNLYEWAGTSFHESLVEQFVQAVGIFPVGSFVELSSGEVAAVLAHNRVRRLEPRVLVLTAPDKTPLPEPFERNLLHRSKTADTVRVRIVRGLAAGAYGLRLRDYYAHEAALAAEPAVG